MRKAIRLQTLIMEFEVRSTEGLFPFAQSVFRRFKGREMLTTRVKTEKLVKLLPVSKAWEDIED
jgi:hypothetical protein